MKKIAGLAGAGGSELAKAFILTRQKVTPRKTAVCDREKEIANFQQIRREYAEELDELYRGLSDSGEKEAEIFKAYRVIVCDDLFFKGPIGAVVDEGINMDYAIDLEKEKVCLKFEGMEEPYLKERMSDIRNVCDELIRRLNGLKSSEEQVLRIHEPFILVAEDLSPEDTIRINKSFLRGFITEKGGITSHVVILAKSLGIPAVVGAGGILKNAGMGKMLYINGDEGYGVTEPDGAFIESFQSERGRREEQKKQYAVLLEEPAVTASGRRVSVCVNTGDSESRKNFREEQCDGIGLFRTEFLFMDQRDYPSEELQFQIYREIAQKARGKEVIIRTLDIGGDKKLDYMNLPKESNPFLGYRAIRVCLDRPEVFVTQIRAILRASAFGNLKMMFPMIVTLEELRQSKEMVEKAKRDLRVSGAAFNEHIPIGVMIETPASVMISDKLAREVDFFSIGTNDLIQYTTATDRMNEKVQYLYDPCNLSVLRAVDQVIRNAHAAGITVGMCGEAASDARLTPLLLAMGLDEISVSPAQVGRMKYIIRRCNPEKLTDWVRHVLDSSSLEETKRLLASNSLE